MSIHTYILISAWSICFLTRILRGLKTKRGVSLVILYEQATQKSKKAFVKEVLETLTTNVKLILKILILQIGVQRMKAKENNLAL